MGEKDFRGEVWSNIHPTILEAIAKINGESVEGNNGKDAHSINATALLQKHFKEKIYTTYTINGTAANILALKAMLDCGSVILCPEQAHLNNNECGACEYNLGCKIIPVPCHEGKLTTEAIESVMVLHKNHKYRPKVIAITQPTEFGTVYTVSELTKLSKYAHERGMYLFVDGARLGNAVVSLRTTLSEMLEDTDVDAFTISGTKSGAMFGEMVVFRRKEFAENLEYLQKQSMQHFDKSKFLGVQLECLLKDNLWLEIAEKANASAKYLEKRLREKGVTIYYPVDANMVFAVLDEETLRKITKKFDLHYWDESLHTVRIATTYETTKEKIDELIALV